MDGIINLLQDLFSQLGDRIVALFSYAWHWVLDNPATAGEWYSGLIRWLMPVLALMILLSVLRSMLRVKNPAEIWGYLVSDQLGRFPLRHWECTIGRSKRSDVVIHFATVSRSQCVLLRQEDGSWLVYDLSQSNHTLLNGKPCPSCQSTVKPQETKTAVAHATAATSAVTGEGEATKTAPAETAPEGVREPVQETAPQTICTVKPALSGQQDDFELLQRVLSMLGHKLTEWGEALLREFRAALRPPRRGENGSRLKSGDVLSFGEIKLTYQPITAEEQAAQKELRLAQSRPLPPWGSLALLTLFQLLTMIELMLARPEHAHTISFCYGILATLMWCYVLFTRAAGRIGFEIEMIAFFSSTLCLAITASSVPSSLPKQTFAVVLGVIGLLMLGWYLRDLKRATATRYPMAFAAIALLLSSLIFGAVTYGAKNWISIAGISLQPSEFAKVCFIFAGAATLDRLYVKHNLWGFMLLSGFCLIALAAMSDFGGVTIFFVVFLVISYLRSGDFATLTLSCGVAAAAAGLILRFKPYIATRFSTWGHAWEFPLEGGYQQVRAMSASASGGLIGVGAGNGWLREVAAADTDLVFAFLCEEWGLIISLLVVAGIIAMVVFTVRLARSARSAFYATAACAAAALLVFQTTLNVLGSVDILPLTGVTFPFLSCGGSSMVASWGMLAFLKAADTRQNASFAVRRYRYKATPQQPVAEGQRDEIEEAFSHWEVRG